MKKNQYAETAQYYDYLTAQSGLNDLPFYLDYVQEKPGQVLELACGTGRIAIPLARAGARVHGIDISAAMLDVFRKKLTKEPPEVNSRIELSQQDLRSFSVDQLFDLILIPFRSFQVMHHRADQLACLRRIRQHLKSDGHFILNVFAATTKIEEQDQEFARHKEYNLPTGQLSIEEQWSVDYKKQSIIIDSTFNWQNADGKEEIKKEHHELYYHFLHQLRALVQEAGLSILSEYGDYDKKPIGQGREFILVLGK